MPCKNRGWIVPSKRQNIIKYKLNTPSLVTLPRFRGANEEVETSTWKELQKLTREQFCIETIIYKQLSFIYFQWPLLPKLKLSTRPASEISEGIPQGSQVLWPYMGQYLYFHHFPSSVAELVTRWVRPWGRRRPSRSRLRLASVKRNSRCNESIDHMFFVDMLVIYRFTIYIYLNIYTYIYTIYIGTYNKYDILQYIILYNKCSGQSSSCWLDNFRTKLLKIFPALSDVFACCDAVAWRIFIKLYNGFRSPSPRYDYPRIWIANSKKVMVPVEVRHFQRFWKWAVTLFSSSCEPP